MATKERIKNCLNMACDEGYISKENSFDELNDLSYEILSFDFSDSEIDELDENEIEKVFNDWRV